MKKYPDSKWSVDPDGNKYKIRYCVDRDIYNVVYKPLNPKCTVHLTPFIVEVRGETWHIQAKDEESAALPFWSEWQPGYPRREELKVRIIELPCSLKREGGTK